MYNGNLQQEYYVLSRVLGTAESFDPADVADRVSPLYDDVFLYESAKLDAERGRYSIVAFGSLLKFNITSRDTFDTFEDFVLRKHKINFLDQNHGLPKMVGCFYGYLNYECAGFFEESISFREKKDVLQATVGVFVLPKFLIIYDNIEKSIRFVVTSDSSDFDLLMSEIDDIVSVVHNRSEKMAVNYGNCNLKLPYKNKNSVVGFEVFSDISKEEYESSVTKCIEYIKSGDAFQVVPSIGFACEYGGNHIDFYKTLRTINPSPFMFYVKVDGYSIIGASPEILVRVKDGVVTIRPLAGTRPRGKTEAEDLQNEIDLLRDIKDVAEHTMLLDLGRNDVGRVSVDCTVRVSQKMIVERYSHVMHISSTVTGELSPDKTVFDALKSGFPAGTVTGAPKIRAIEIVDEVEDFSRSFYGGCVGYISKNVLDTCITLRSCVIKDGILYTRAGAGVVFDSNPTKEYQECVNKAGAIIKAANFLKH